MFVIWYFDKHKHYDTAKNIQNKAGKKYIWSKKMGELPFLSADFKDDNVKEG